MINLVDYFPKYVKETCKHPFIHRRICIGCGQRLDGDDESTRIAFNYVINNLQISVDEIARIRKLELQKLLDARKLCLVLDLDHTLLHTADLCDLSPEEYYFKQSDLSRSDIFVWESMGTVTKLRPFNHKFLAKASKLFNLYIYTMGNRIYARKMAEYLDPENKYFSQRVISREDCTQKGQKGLDIVPVDESVVVILDDSESVWARHADNLILMPRYYYFSSKTRSVVHKKSRSHSEQITDESETAGALKSVLGVLKRIHSWFFETHNYFNRDVREMLKIVRKEVSKDCKLVFGQDVKRKTVGYRNLWTMAEQKGASCLYEYGSDATTRVNVENKEEFIKEAEDEVSKGKQITEVEEEEEEHVDKEELEDLRIPDGLRKSRRSTKESAWMKSYDIGRRVKNSEKGKLIYQLCTLRATIKEGKCMLNEITNFPHLFSCSSGE